MNKVHYRKDYLGSDYWQRTKDLFSSLSEYTCLMCPSSQHLEIHHLHYHSLGREKLENLVYLCRVCHKKATFDLIFKSTVKKEARQFYKDKRKERRAWRLQRKIPIELST